MLKYSSFDDLCNWARVSSHLREAARLEFRRRYIQKRIYVVSLGVSPGYAEEVEHVLTIHGLKLGFFVLRVFGAEIEDLSVSMYYSDFDKETVIGAYISDYCFEKLHRLRLHNFLLGTFGGFTSVFLNLNVLIIDNCVCIHLGLDRWFPALTVIFLINWCTFGRADHFAAITAESSAIRDLRKFCPSIFFDF